MSFFSDFKRPFLIAGPCSAETEAQVLETARGLQGTGVRLFRAGVWKPRTRPGSFEGNGSAALDWLVKMRQETGLPFAIEIAEPAHLEAALEHGADVLWIGARTVVNPFQVQRLADALKGVAIPVMVKNPVNPDAELWLGAIERLEGAGIRDIAAIHRGFSSYNAASVYRNQPNWAIPIELKRRRPGLPIICDPSHIAGRRALVPEIAQKAMDMGFEGLMIETHPHPDEAWSDAAQQLTPDSLKQLLQQLVVREEHAATTEDTRLQIEYLRQVMDTIDAEIIDLLARRMELSSRLGLIKKAGNITAYQPDRWRDIVETRSARARKLELSEEFVLALYEKIHHESVKKQLSIMQADNDTSKD